jgi:hypothetical protein
VIVIVIFFPTISYPSHLAYTQSTGYATNIRNKSCDWLEDPVRRGSLINASCLDGALSIPFVKCGTRDSRSYEIESDQAIQGGERDRTCSYMKLTSSSIGSAVTSAYSRV